MDTTCQKCGRQQSVVNGRVIAHRHYDAETVRRIREANNVGAVRRYRDRQKVK